MKAIWYIIKRKTFHDEASFLSQKVAEQKWSNNEASLKICEFYSKQGHELVSSNGLYEHDKLDSSYATNSEAYR